MNLSSGNLYEEKIAQLEEELNALRVEAKERNALEAQLCHAQKMEALAFLAGGVAHDFNNILQAILGYCQFGLMQVSESFSPQYALQQIEQMVAKGRDLTDQFLTVGRKVDDRVKPIQLNARIKNVHKLLWRTFPRMIEFHLRLAEDLPMISADSGQVDQVLMNLCINARDAMGDSGQLTLATDVAVIEESRPGTLCTISPGEFVHMAVIDTGPGIPDNQIETIFEPFFSTKERGKGTGLGLSTVFSIVKDHKGFIECDGGAGHGAVFHLYFPILQEAALEDKTVDEEPLGDRFAGTETVLLVDDEGGILEACREMFGRLGYTVLTATTGENAIELYRATTVDAVILDVGMPGMGGKSCLEELLKINTDAKVLIVSGYSSRDYIEEVCAVGAKGFLRKPYRFKDLFTQLRAMLGD